MREEDKRTLDDCVGVLLPLGHQSEVQAQLKDPSDVRETVWYRAGILTMKMVEYAADFRNTGVERLYGDISAFFS